MTAATAQAGWTALATVAETRTCLAQSLSLTLLEHVIHLAWAVERELALSYELSRHHRLASWVMTRHYARSCPQHLTHAVLCHRAIQDCPASEQPCQVAHCRPALDELLPHLRFDQLLASASLSVRLEAWGWAPGQDHLQGLRQGMPWVSSLQEVHYHPPHH